MAAHPLDPLTGEEIDAALAVLRRSGHVTDATRFPFVALAEPTKGDVRRFERGRAEGSGIDRQALVSMFDLRSKQVTEALVSLTDDRVLSVRERPGVGPGLLDDERDAFEPVIRQDPRWREAMRRRGVTDLGAVHFECVAMENRDPAVAGSGTVRRARCVGFLRTGPDSNYYAHPIDGVVVVVDVAANEVLEVVENEPWLPIPSESGDFTPEAIAQRVTRERPPLRPLDIVQHEGVSFELDGRHLTWAGWQMHVGFRPTEGLVLHRISFDDGRKRPILHRAALSEMVVPYGDTAIGQYWRAVFDAGEVGLGQHANSLELGCDCLGEIRYLDAAVADPDGSVRTIRNAICIHEEDVGIAWKHDGVHVATSEVRRNRRLVVSFFATIGNYDYGFYWYFYPDASIEVEVKLTGIIYTGAIADGQHPDHGTLVADNLYGPHHQHLFCFRLDTEIDGPHNSVVEVDSVTLPRGPSNPHGNAFEVVETVLETEEAAARLADTARARYWKVVNESSTNRFGAPVGYKLMPHPTAPLLATADAYVSQVGAFGTHHLWVTPFSDDERYAAGDYPAFGDVGLATWAQQDRPVRGEELVVWHVVGTTHVVRPEDWPIMPVERVGFAFQPVGFFDHNPALDLAAPEAAACHGSGDPA